MNSNTLYQLTVEGNDLIIRLNSKLVDREKLVKWLDSLERESIRRECWRKEMLRTAQFQHSEHTA